LGVPLLWISDTLGIGALAAFLLAAFTSYLVMAIIKGNVKFGEKFPFLFTIHPLRPGETLMNSFLFNVSLIMISIFALVQFITNAFLQYVRLTVVDIYFNLLIQNMKFFNIFYSTDLFEKILVYWAGITLIINFLFGRDRPFELGAIQKLKGIAGKVTFGLVSE